MKRQKTSNQVILEYMKYLNATNMKSKKQKIIEYYTNKKNWKLTPPSYSTICKKCKVTKSYVHNVLKEYDNQRGS